VKRLIKRKAFVPWNQCRWITVIETCLQAIKITVFLRYAGITAVFKHRPSDNRSYTVASVLLQPEQHLLRD
jgi:hypothetical protein